MRYIAKYLIFGMIGIVPNVLGGYSFDTWQWWAIILTLDIGVWLHDAVKI